MRLGSVNIHSPLPTRHDFVSRVILTQLFKPKKAPMEALSSMCHWHISIQGQRPFIKAHYFVVYDHMGVVSFSQDVSSIRYSTKGRP
jgi:hypothetical protein